MQLFTLAGQTIFPEYGEDGSLQSRVVSFPADSMDPATCKFDRTKIIPRTAEEYCAEWAKLRHADVMAERERCARLADELPWSLYQGDDVSALTNAKGVVIGSQILAIHIRDGSTPVHSEQWKTSAIIEALAERV